MCSILFSTKPPIQDLKKINYYLKFRGPDHTTSETINGHLFVHNLLAITGEFTPQPYKEDDIVALYNGEMYNYKEFGNYKSDGECVIPLYKKHGKDFIKHLDGEFALCLVDYSKQEVIISSDIFKTKPLFLAVDKDGIGCASYSTPLKELGYKNIFKASCNTAYVLCLKTFKVKDHFEIHQFDTKQYKTTYDDWIAAFKKAVHKRIVNTTKNIFIGLSSGYDSGIIFYMLDDLKNPFYSYSLLGTEHEGIIKHRIANKPPHANCYALRKNNNDYVASHRYIEQTTEPFNYTVFSDGIKTNRSPYNEYNLLLIKDAGSNNFATVCRAARADDCKICLSGTGADEIISDYGFGGESKFSHSNFGGQFPKDLDDIFPWPSFYGSTLESYIAKEEYVGGSFGIEMRYPFLDKEVVQEFLWLSQDLKNAKYKGPIASFFDNLKVPYEEGAKRGF